MRGVLERASARETAARVAAGAVASQCLRAFGIELLAHVVALGGVGAGASPAAPLAAGWQGTPREQRLLGRLRLRRDRSPFYTLSPAADGRIRRAVLAARRAGDTLGGCFEVLALGVPPGLGSLQGWDSRLDSRLGAGLLSIPAIKAVEIGDGLRAAGSRGSAVHDAVGRPGRAGPTRRGNRAGGLEAGMSNGQPLVVRAFMKPLPTLARSLPSWDYAQGAPAKGFFERSDVTSVPAASVVGEAMVALVVLDALLEKTGGDTLAEVERALAGQRIAVARQFGRGARRVRRSGRGGTRRRAARGKRG
jgi:chorismate synthase